MARKRETRPRNISPEVVRRRGSKGGLARTTPAYHVRKLNEAAVTDRLSEDNLRELARLIRETHARHAARLERERQEAGNDDPR